MSEADNFLKRWSRRKTERRHEAERRHEVEREDTPPAPTPQEAADKSAEPAESALPTSPPAFDPASLPSIDSITATTDISGFLQPGVPEELRNAALRRAWSVDPAIRDFRGLQENDWNFNDPNGIPGFGPLSADLDVGKMASALFGDVSHGEQSGTQVEEGEACAAAPTPIDPNRGVPPDGSSTQSEIVQRDENLAPQNQDSKPVARRSHRGGGALPET